MHTAEHGTAAVMLRQAGVDSQELQPHRHVRLALSWPEQKFLATHC